MEHLQQEQSVWIAFKDSNTSYLIMEKKKTKQEGVEVSREDRYVDRCGTGLLDGQRHACVYQEQTNHIAQPRAPCNTQTKLLSGVLKHLTAPTHKAHAKTTL